MLERFARTLITVLPDAAAAEVVRRLAMRTRRPPVQPTQHRALAAAQRVFYGRRGDKVAWSWGQGPLVLFVHGWNGRAAQMALLAQHVAGLGFRSVAIEVTGHGDSPGQHTAWRCFIDDVAELTQALSGPAQAWVGHSAGALAMMAARRIKGLGAARYVAVCAPSHPYPPIRGARQRLAPRESVLARYRDLIAAQFDASWAELQAGLAFAGVGPELLLVYDESDRFVDPSEGDRILGLCPGACLLKTYGQGHSRVLAAPELAAAVGDWLRPLTPA